MARKPRIHYPGAVYHVILRGNGKQDIFFNDQDRYRFYLLLQEGVERFRHRIHAFCLMTSHVHLVVQVDDIPLSRIMQNLSFRYTQWVNWRHKRTGHLFQGRYKAVLVDGDSYLLELVRYVHLNPVRAKMVDLPEQHPWTGHHAYCGKEILPWLCTDSTLSMLAKGKGAATRAYISFVQDGLEEGRKGEFHGEGVTDSRIFGDDDFVERMAGKGEEIPAKVSLEEVIAATCVRCGVDANALSLRGKNQTLSHARGMVAWIVQDLPSITLTELARRTGRDISSLSAMARRLEKRAESEESLLREKEEILRQITRYKA
jgi:putative transposase